MTDLIQLKESSYKGVPYLAKVMPTNGGRRLNVIRYPGADTQSIEDQGLIPRQFSITGIIPHENYYNVRDNLLRVFEDGIKGSLIHPTFGKIENVRNGKYSINETISKLGRAEFTVEFFVDGATGIPVSSGNTASQVQAASEVLNTALVADIVAGYTVTSSFTGNFTAATNDALNVSSAISDASTIIQSTSDDLNEFNGKIVAYANNVTTLIQTPSALGGGIGGLFTSLNNLYDSATETVAIISTLFDFGANDNSFAQNTAGRIERQKNQDLIRANIKTQSLSYAYVSAVQIAFDNEDSLAAISAQLEDQYTDVRDNELLSNETLITLDDLRIQANAALAEILLNTRKVITINTRQIPLPVLVFEYYGSTDLVDVISELNGVQQSAFVSGDIRILTV